MKLWQFAILIPVVLCALTGCDGKNSDQNASEEPVIGENIDEAEREAAKKLQAVADPVEKDIETFNAEIRGLLTAKRFDELEKMAAELRSSKSLFRDGSWKIRQFYVSMEASDDEADKVWKDLNQIHQEWIQAMPKSITAHVAQANFYVNYAWYVRGSGYVSTVTERENYSFEKRLESALKVLQTSRDFPEKDPMWWNVALTTALGQGWPLKAFDELVEEAMALEPTYHRHDYQRAYSLLPRWYGEPGDWEAYALKAAERKGGLGAEAYARIVIGLRSYEGQIFQKSEASWPKTKEGLMILRKKYPDSLRFINEGALLATMASDQAYAKEMFDLLGDTYMRSVFSKPDRFAHYRNWARTGQW